MQKLPINEVPQQTLLLSIKCHDGGLDLRRSRTSQSAVFLFQRFPFSARPSMSQAKLVKTGSMPTTTTNMEEFMTPDAWKRQDENSPWKDVSLG
jgi:hypothetical protein